MSSGVEAPGELPPAARGDDDPALSEHDVSVGSERHASVGEEWAQNDHSNEAPSWDPWTSWGGRSWDRTRRGAEQDRRTSWTTSTGRRVGPRERPGRSSS